TRRARLMDSAGIGCGAGLMRPRRRRCAVALRRRHLRGSLTLRGRRHRVGRKGDTRDDKDGASQLAHDANSGAPDTGGGSQPMLIPVYVARMLALARALATGKARRSPRLWR